MKHFDTNELARRARLVTWGPEPADPHVREGASMRLVAAMAEPLQPGSNGYPFQGARVAMSPFAVEPAENDAQYFQRRSVEERRAAAAAAGPEASAAHLELSRRYSRLSRRETSFGRVASRQEPFAQPVSERKRRLDDLLDEALLGSFPASDPVSIAHVR